jgi:hypothetical protein
MEGVQAQERIGDVAFDFDNHCFFMLMVTPLDHIKI